MTFPSYDTKVLKKTAQITITVFIIVLESLLWFYFYITHHAISATVPQSPNKKASKMTLTFLKPLVEHNTKFLTFSSALI